MPAAKGTVTLTDVQDGAAGTSVFQASIFRRAAAYPGSPTGGSYDFTTGTLTPPTGWSVAPPRSTELYLTGGSGDDVNQYSIDKSLILSSAVAKGVSGSIAAYDASPASIVLRPDGLAAYTVGSSGYLFCFELTEAYNIASLVPTPSSSFRLPTGGTSESSPAGLCFRPDGRYVYLIGLTRDRIIVFSLSTPWDVSSATYVGQPAAAISGLGAPREVIFSPDGTSYFVVGSLTVPTPAQIKQFSLSTPWDPLSTQTLLHTYSVMEGSSGNSLVFSEDGHTLLLVDNTNDRIYEYELSTPWLISTMSYTSRSISLIGVESTATGLYTIENKGGIYSSSYLFSAATPGALVTAGSWSSPVELTAPKAAEAYRVGVLSTVYLRSATTPTTPTGGYYSFLTNSIVPPAGWSASAVAGSGPLWSSTTAVVALEAMSIGDNLTWSTPIKLVENGAAGLNNAVVSLFAKSTSDTVAPTSFTGTATYTFSSDTLTGLTLGSWSRTAPALAQGEYLWVRQATASSAATADTIGIAEWSSGVVLSYSGVDGLNSQPLFLYAKSTSSVTPPTSFTGTATYTFSSDSLSGLTLGVWSRTAPSLAAGEYLWMTQATASSRTATDSILLSEWSVAAVVGVGGATGQRGAGWWRYDAGSAVVAGLSTSAVAAYFTTAVGLAPVIGDRFILASTSGTTAYLFVSSSWVEQTAFFDGNLLVAGTVTTDAIAANAVTADKMQVSSLDAITATLGTFQSASTGERVVIASDYIKVFDANNIARVIVGDLTA